MYSTLVKNSNKTSFSAYAQQWLKFPKSGYYIDSDAVQLQASYLWEEKDPTYFIL